MIRTSPTVEVSPDELAEIAFNSGATIDLPAARAGWAYLEVAGKHYRAWLCAPIRRVQA